jgi:excisionase family DNA binding protein
MNESPLTLADILASGRTLFTEIEAAAFLDTSVGTLQVWRSTGRYGIPFVKIGRSVRYKRADLEAWIESRTRSTGATA